MKVLVTGGAGQIAYSLIPLICNGLVFGPSTRITLQLLDIEPAKQALGGVAMEIQDAAYSLVDEILVTTDLATAFKGVDVAILLAGFPRKAGMERKDLIEKNVGIFKQHGTALEKYASRDVKVVVVANPANTNCLIAMKYAPSLPRENFTCLTRLDHDRLRGMVRERVNMVEDRSSVGSSCGSEASSLGSACDLVRNVVIWGNHSQTQVPDTSSAEARVNGKWFSVHDLLRTDEDREWLGAELTTAVQGRGSAVIAARKLSSALSAANAVAAHLRDWLTPSGATEGVVSMGVYSEGGERFLSIPEGLMFSMPVRCANGKWEVATELGGWGPDLSEGIAATTLELAEERTMAEDIIARPCL